ncbi:MAG: hypothetical protein K5762_07835 [Bacilli bacterium]|nr:hypothetical protein [Bacilli bacterium]
MKDSFDICFNNMRKAEFEDEHMALLAVFPCIQMLLKLMNRKQSGKKPFSESLHYDEKKDMILKDQTLLENELKKNRVDREACIFALRNIKEIALTAEKEIKLASLKGDYCYLASVFEDSAVFLSENQF